MKGNIAAVCCEFKYSGVASGLIAVACIGTLAVTLASLESAALRAAVSMWIVAMGAHAARLLGAVRSLRLDGSGRVEVADTRGGIRVGRVRDGSFVCPWLTIVRWRYANGWIDRAVVVLPGMVQREEFRRLRVLLRWG